MHSLYKLAALVLHVTGEATKKVADRQEDTSMSKVQKGMKVRYIIRCVMVFLVVLVVVGNNPGASKVGKANAKGTPLVDFLSLQRLLVGQSTLESAASAPPPRITNFSKGYPGRKEIAY